MTHIRTWIKQQDVFDYVVNAYVGARPVDNGHGNAKSLRRIFTWVKDGVVYEGNIQAFASHLQAQFGLAQQINSMTREINALLLSLGERVRRPRTQPLHPKSFQTHRESDPDFWIVARIRTERVVSNAQ